MQRDSRGQAAPPPARFLQAGDQALVVEFGSDIDPRTSRIVQAFDRNVAKAGIDAVLETVPTYRSVLVLYDPLRITAAALKKRLVPLLPTRIGRVAGGRLWTLPVAYGGALGEDLEAVAAQHDLTPDQAIALHSGATYDVYMIGFAPGLTYLGGLPERLHTPRRSDPRLLIPAGSISIGGQQAAVMSVAIPSGWHLLGRTPVRTFDLRRREPFLLATGDRVRFRPIGADEYARLEARAERGEVLASVESDR